jgi:CRP-like cAMP-binding protein
MRAEFSDSDAAQAVQGLLMKLRARDIVTEEEEAVLRASVAEIREYPSGRPIVRVGTTLSASTLLVEGLVCRYKDLADGQRQIMELHVAGDFVDLHGFLLKRLDHNVGTLTPVRIASVPHDALRGITETHPHLGRMLWFSTLLDAAIHREKILSVGRRSALAVRPASTRRPRRRFRLPAAAHAGGHCRRHRPDLGPRQPDAQEAARR